MDLHTWWRTRGVEQKQPHLQRAPDGARSEVKKGKSKKKRENIKQSKSKCDFTNFLKHHLSFTLATSI
jgi:hypothetical protein